ncbi:C-Jun-amino-terminal kinase-interacting protein 3 [Geodia barretti]|uniref:C-Jun-amino-terminal kinase-interacting protein 3 n=2 Tax=Geodia barretti TaxID=519541 RepID=A0AA35TTX2_GEOBA|nr:C-Jun-amino-terminal kinase-interacting protein 3 [Geodia barretti]
MTVKTAYLASLSVTPTPILLKSFTVDSTRILAMCYVPRDSSSHQSSPLQSSMSSAIIGAPSLSANSETIWMGSQTGKLMIHPTSNEMAHKVMEVINFAGPITCIEYYKNQVFIAVEGNVYIYKRPKDSAWDLDNPVAFRIHDGDDPINCMCQVQQKLWLGAGNRCYVFNMASSRRETHDPPNIQ